MSYTVAMKVDRPQEFGPIVNAVSMPSMLLSGLMLPMALTPGRLDVLSHFMPIRSAVEAMRDAYVGHCATAHMLYGVLVAPGGARRDGRHTWLPQGGRVTTLTPWSI